MDEKKDCMAEEFVSLPSGPVAAIAGSDVTTPYPMSLIALGLVQGYFDERSATLGELFLHAKQAMMKETTDPRRKAIDLLANLWGGPKEGLAAERLDHLNRFNLFGDPLLHVTGKRIEELNLTISEKVCPGQTRINKRSRVGETVRISGWARLYDGSSAQELLVVREGVIVGVAKRARTYWLGHYPAQIEALSGPSQIVARILPHRLAYTFGLHAEWVGAMRAVPTDASRSWNSSAASNSGSALSAAS